MILRKTIRVTVSPSILAASVAEYGKGIKAQVTDIRERFFHDGCGTITFILEGDRDHLRENSDKLYERLDGNKEIRSYTSHYDKVSD